MDLSIRQLRAQSHHHHCREGDGEQDHRGPINEFGEEPDRLDVQDPKRQGSDDLRRDGREDGEGGEESSDVTWRSEGKSEGLHRGCCAAAEGLDEGREDEVDGSETECRVGVSYNIDEDGRLGEEEVKV